MRNALKVFFADFNRSRYNLAFYNVVPIIEWLFFPETADSPKGKNRWRLSLPQVTIRGKWDKLSAPEPSFRNPAAGLPPPRAFSAPVPFPYSVTSPPAILSSIDGVRPFPMRYPHRLFPQRIDMKATSTKRQSPRILAAVIIQLLAKRPSRPRISSATQLSPNPKTRADQPPPGKVGTIQAVRKFSPHLVPSHFLFFRNGL